MNYAGTDALIGPDPIRDLMLRFRKIHPSHPLVKEGFKNP